MLQEAAVESPLARDGAVGRRDHLASDGDGPDIWLQAAAEKVSQAAVLANPISLGLRKLALEQLDVDPDENPVAREVVDISNHAPVPVFRWCMVSGYINVVATAAYRIITLRLSSMAFV